MHSGPLFVKLAVPVDFCLWGEDNRRRLSGALCLSVPILLGGVLGPPSDFLIIGVLANLALQTKRNVLEVLGVLGVIDVSGDFPIQLVDLITVVDVIVELQPASQSLVLELGRPRCQITKGDQVGAGHHDQKGRPAHYLGLMAGALPLDIGREFLGGKFKISNAAHKVFCL